MDNTAGDNTAGSGDYHAKEEVALPAILLMVGAALGILGALGGLMLYSESTLRWMVEHPEAPTEARDQLRQYMGQLGPIRTLLGVQLALSALSFVGALMMKMCRNFPLAVVGAIAACLPCLGPCCGITGLPFGIWSLIVLFRPEVKKAFQ